MSGTELRTIPESEYGFYNVSDLPDAALTPRLREIASSLSKWVASTQQPESRRGRGGMFDRNSYVTPTNPLARMVLARKAVQEDDIVGGVADLVEGLMFQGAKWESEDPDDADVFNQISADLDVDGFLRAASRELYTCSQVVAASFWGRKTYIVRGRVAPTKPPVVDPLAPPEMPKPGRKRRKPYDVMVPTMLTILDSTRVIPVGNMLWGKDRLAWHATGEEMRVWAGMDSGVIGENFDATLSQLIIGRYYPDDVEAALLCKLGVDPDRLLELNPARVWRHCLTKPSYEKWSDNRLGSVFRLLDLKSQLMEADRVQLVGAANYILLVKKGLPDEPAHQGEIDHLKENFNVVAKLPVIISDHRLEIEIITPKTDLTLDPGKYDVLDRRLLGRLLGSMSIPGGAAGARDTTLTVGRMVARLLESRRHMLKRAVEANIARAIMEANENKFAEEPNLAYTPRQVQLDTDPQTVQAVMALRTQRELSRDSILEYFGFDQSVEAQHRVMEDEHYDDIFQTAVPFDSPINNAGGIPPGSAGPGASSQVKGATGGRPSGGGTPKKSTTVKKAST